MNSPKTIFYMLMETLVDDIFTHIGMCFSTFDDDIIVKWRGFVSLVRFSQTCKRLNRLYASNSRIWTNLYKRDIDENETTKHGYGNALLGIGNIRPNKALFTAVKYGYNKAIGYFFKKGANMNKSIVKKCLVNEKIAQFGLSFDKLLVNGKFLEELLSCNTFSLSTLQALWLKRYGRTRNLLVTALKYSSLDICEWLIEQGMKLTDEQKISIKDVVRPGFVKLLVKLGVKINPVSIYQVSDAQDLLDTGFDVNENQGQMLIDVCSRDYPGSMEEEVKKILFYGANPALRDNEALKILLKRGNVGNCLSAAELLVNNGADQSLLGKYADKIYTAPILRCEVMDHTGKILKKQSFVETIKLYLAENDKTHGKYRKILTVLENYRYMMQNKWFLVKYPKFLKTAYDKILELHYELLEVLLPLKQRRLASEAEFFISSLYAEEIEKFVK